MPSEQSPREMLEAVTLAANRIVQVDMAELAELRRKAAAWDAAQTAWLVSVWDGSRTVFLYEKLSNSQYAAEKKMHASGFRPQDKARVVPVRVVEEVQ